MWRWLLSVAIAARPARRPRRGRAAPRRRPFRRRRRRGGRHGRARRCRCRGHLARVAADHRPPQPHHRAAHRHRVRAASPARRPARGRAVGRRRRRRARRQRQGRRAGRSPGRRSHRPVLRGPRRARSRCRPRPVAGGRARRPRAGCRHRPPPARRRIDEHARRGDRRPPRNADAGAIVRLRDVTEREERVRALEQARRRFQQAFHSAPTGMALVRLDDSTILDANRSLAEMLDRPVDDLVGRTHPRGHPPRGPARRGRPPGAARAGHRRHLPARPALPAQRRRVRVGAHPRRRHRGRGRCTCNHPHRGRHRAAAHGRAAAVGGDARRPDRPAEPHRADPTASTSILTDAAVGDIAMLFIDLDNFKAVNDSLGHGIGDTLLTAMSVRLRDVVGEEAVLARFGGDEFIVVLRHPDRDPIAVAEEVARRRAPGGRRRGHRAVRQHEHRRVGERPRGRHRRRPAARRRRGDVPRQGARAGLRRGVRPRHARDDGAGPAHGDRAAARPRARRDRALLPADRRADDRPRDRASRRSPAGCTPSAACCRPTSSCRWPRRPG